MKLLKYTAILALILAVSCKDQPKEKEVTDAVQEAASDFEQIIEDADVETLQMKLESKSDSEVVGTVEFVETNGVVTMTASLTGLTEGRHAIHIHEKADCSSADGKSSGGHWNPTFEPHGEWGNQTGYHRGDIGNFDAKADGSASVYFETDLWCLSCDDETKNIRGKAIIVHQGVDDLTSQPSGAAGARVSCGGIIE